MTMILPSVFIDDLTERRKVAEAETPAVSQGLGPGSTQTLSISGLLNDYIGDIRGYERYGDDTIDYYSREGNEWYINGEDIVGYFLRELHPYIADFTVDGPGDKVTVTLADAQTLSDLMYIELDDPGLNELDAADVIDEADREMGATRRTRNAAYDLAKEDDYAAQSNIFYNQILPHIEEDWGLQGEIESLKKSGTRKDFENFIDEVWVDVVGWSPYWEEGIMDEMLGELGLSGLGESRKRRPRRRIGEAELVNEAVARVFNTQDTLIELELFEHAMLTEQKLDVPIKLVRMVAPKLEKKQQKEAAERILQMVLEREKLGWDGYWQASIHAVNEATSGPADEQAARELELYIENDADLYRQMYIPQVKNLIRKKDKGTYDSELAVKLFMYLATEGARKYIRAHGTAGERVDSIFNKNTRLEVARRLRDTFEAEYEANAFEGI